MAWKLQSILWIFLPESREVSFTLYLFGLLIVVSLSAFLVGRLRHKKIHGALLAIINSIDNHHLDGFIRFTASLASHCLTALCPYANCITTTMGGGFTRDRGG